MSTPTVKKLSMAILVANPFEETVAFYKKIGLEVVFHLKDKWAEVAVGPTRLGICPTSVPAEDRRTGLVLEVDDVRACHEQWQQAGVQFAHEVQESVHGIMASIKDPAGNIIDIYQPTPEKVRELAEKVAKQSCKKDGGQAGACGNEAGRCCKGPDTTEQTSV